MLLLAVVLAGCAQAPSRPAGAHDARPSLASIARHVANAEAAAGTDLRRLLSICHPASGLVPPEVDVDPATGADLSPTLREPARAFDNLHYVGSNWVSAWALDTPGGLVLIDALDKPSEARALIAGGLRKLGRDPADIRYIVVTHNHFDHYGGAGYLAATHGARIVMSQADAAEGRKKPGLLPARWGGRPDADIEVADGDSLADTRVLLHVTPGHTTGTLSPMFEVVHAGRPHKALLWGGPSLNVGKNIDLLDKYIAATERMAGMARDAKVDVLLSNHPQFDRTAHKLRGMGAPGSANPFVIGTADVVRSLEVMGHCARAQRDRVWMHPAR